VKKTPYNALNRGSLKQIMCACVCVRACVRVCVCVHDWKTHLQCMSILWTIKLSYVLCLMLCITRWLIPDEILCAVAYGLAWIAGIHNAWRCALSPVFNIR
jgi:hypothetical protein